ncbi:hypothetical protein BKA69DRAFT_1041583 [Paraphysoderma sedebokerense]|nr:hypothetical protein BKA69DRAFT_1041583 [Paraphysoderma sedebokerense]
MSSSSSSPSISTSISDHPYAKKEEKLKQRRRGVGHHQTAFRGFTIIKPPSWSANSNTSNHSDKSINNDNNDNVVDDHNDYIDHMNDVGQEYENEFNQDNDYDTCQPDISDSPSSFSYNTTSSCNNEKESDQYEVEFAVQEEHLVQSLRVVSLHDSTSVEKQQRKTQIGVKEKDCGKEENDSFEYTKVENRIQTESQSRGRNESDGFTFIRREKKSKDVETDISKHSKPLENIKMKKKEEVNEDRSQPVMQKSKRKLVQKKTPTTESHQPNTFDHYDHNDFDPLSVGSSEYLLHDIPVSVSEHQTTKSDKTRIKPHKPRNDQNDTKFTKSTTVVKSTAMTQIDVNVEIIPRLTRAQSKVLGIKPVYQRKFGEDLKLFYKKREAE